MIEVWKIIARFDVEGKEEEVIDFTTSEAEASKLVAFHAMMYGPYAAIRKSLESEDD